MKSKTNTVKIPKKKGWNMLTFRNSTLFVVLTALECNDYLRNPGCLLERKAPNSIGWDWMCSGYNQYAATTCKMSQHMIQDHPRLWKCKGLGANVCPVTYWLSKTAIP